MRRHGVVTSAVDLVPFAHLGWGYRDRDDFGARAAECIVGALRGDQRIEYVGNAGREALRAELADLGFDEQLRSGRIRVMPVEDSYEFYPDSDVVDAEATVAERVEATDQAIADGYRGLCTVNDAIELTRTPEQRDAWAAFEFLIDQRMPVLPFSALCAYDVNGLGRAAAELLCLHPFVGPDEVGFRMFAEPGVDFVLVGEIDAANDDAFTAALRRTWPLLGEGTIVIDAHGLSFITHTQLRTLDDYARAQGRQVVLQTDQCIVARVAELLELTNVRVQGASPVRSSWQSCDA
ncbi:MEDS domain-containing protein [Mycobacterium noviomagense]|uniref:MEDS domain-containing protein n=1 Tax=Mycobacterium noviomagense TaxID=459858 RepID=A0A7I7PEA0_9MYCO|nr:MEDS domain-containing protein [Mycobacterium noviomagense]ORB10969.1 hypothetical protein BST37_21510 [Mycobacterium noviomagense]BBY06881.1 hypothetical protein MNVI_21990 [Mycobacterium noviomagense]